MYTDVTAYGKIITTPTISHCTSIVLLFMIKPQSCQEFLKLIFENTNIIVFFITLCIVYSSLFPVFHCFMLGSL